MRRVGLCLCLLLACWLAAPAANFAALEPQGYVTDYAGVVEPATRAALEQYCSRLEAATGVQIAVLIIPALEGEPIEDVANAVFQKWGVGKKGSDEGLLLLLSTGDKRMRLEVGYGLEPIIPDGFAGEVLRSMRPALRGSRYGDAVTEAVRTLGARIAQSKGVSLDSGLPRRELPERRRLPVPVILFAVFTALWAISAIGGSRAVRRRGAYGDGALTGLLIGGILGRGLRSGGGGGGFGGFDSGGGFGGFGGGSSGGGGASSSW